MDTSKTQFTELMDIVNEHMRYIDVPEILR